jgi:hypothetical protein
MPATRWERMEMIWNSETQWSLLPLRACAAALGFNR